MINIAIIDDQNLFRQSLALLVNSVENFNLIAECTDGQKFIDTLNHAKYKVDIAIVDMDMPNMNGIDLNKYLHKHYPDIKVIILTVHVNEMLITRVINAGAASYLIKNCDKDELIETIEAVYKNGFYFNNEIIKAFRNNGGHHPVNSDLLELPVPLSNREIQILQMICREMNNEEIAKELFLSARTIEGYRTSLINKIKCRNVAGLVLFAIKHHLIDLSL
ncbi:response regulator [Mucilaginibacter litoreus]|uniref:Response regulator n=1 Tax=Mucilaginibacter litoreus TaxID=1048221 RepID=A0ABW3ASM2_9SPHI